MAADQGIAEAQMKVGYCYATGNGVPKNLEEAAKWYRLAAEQGNAKAQITLGYYYEPTTYKRTPPWSRGCSIIEAFIRSPVKRSQLQS